MLNRHTQIGLAALAIGSWVTFGTCNVAQATPIQVSFDSFEDPNILPSTSDDGANAPGWFDTGHPNTSGIIHETAGTFTTPYGVQALKVWQGNQTGARKTLEALEAGMTYVISFNVSARDNRSTGDFRAELWAGPTAADVDLVLLDSVEGTVTSNDMSESVTHTFDTSSGTGGHLMQLRLVDPLSGQVTGAWQDGPYYDNVLLTKQSSVIPEPASIALLVLGGCAMLLRRRR